MMIMVSWLQDVSVFLQNCNCRQTVHKPSPMEKPTRRVLQRAHLQDDWMLFHPEVCIFCGRLKLRLTTIHVNLATLTLGVQMAG